MNRDSDDPITLTVIQAGLSAAADEMFSMLRKTAMSPIIYEVLDVGTGITDGQGNLVGSGAGIPTFVGVLDKAVQRIIALHEGSVIAEGDMFITNDPNFGGVTHLNDIVIAMPVFAAGKRIAWTACIAHWSDIGGMTPGSMSTKASELAQEGLRLPAVHLFRAGRPVNSLFDVICANSRLPDFARGDLWSQIAACRRAAERVRQLADSYGPGTFGRAVSALFSAGEARSLKGLGELTPGRWEISVEQDSGDLWSAAITVTPQSFEVDLRNNPEQKASPYNTSRDGAVISAQMIFKALTDPQRFANAGSFRPLRVETRPGSVFHAEEPAPHGYYFETRIRLFDMLWRCLADAFPQRLPAGHFGSICGTVIAGRHPDSGRAYTMVEPQMGGWGATAARAGLDAMYSTSHGETYNCPVEICEARYGIDVGWKRLSDRPRGKALHPGGRGLSTCYRPRHAAILAAGFSCGKHPVWGTAGGAEGGHNSLTVIRLNGDREIHNFVSDCPVGPGDEIVIETANGGGWGPAGRETGQIAT
ncbi:MAG: hydantoinase B/oxoprolinase family protein [Rhodobacteraceae bacterium]|nr:hydantoinase B/oxoprolinase family protein [Paracoccaceae bacterium]